MQLLAKFSKILYIRLRATLNFRKIKVTLNPKKKKVRSQPLDDCGRSSQRSISSKIMAVRTIEIGSGAVDRRK